MLHFITLFWEFFGQNVPKFKYYVIFSYYCLKLLEIYYLGKLNQKCCFLGLFLLDTFFGYENSGLTGVKCN